MERNRLEEIIKNGENSGIEFKVEIDTPEDLAKEVVAFLNFRGGIILVGVSDNSEVVGTKEDLEEWIMNICRDLINPPIIPFYEKILLDDKVIIVLTIPQGIDKPYCVFKKNRRTYYIRVGTTVREATREELRRIYQASGQIHYDTLPVHNSLPKDLAEEYINEYFKDYRLIDILDMSDEEKTRLLINSGILVNTEQGIVCSVGGILLFGKEPDRFLYQSGINFAHYKGCDISDELIDRKDFNKTLVENIQDVCSAVKLNVPVPSKVIGLKREEEIFYPEKVVRETVVNACVHRDYTIYGAKIRVFLFDDKLIIRSPGIPPNTITIENMKIGYSVPRNPMLLKFMFDYHFIEGLGRGIPMIIKTMKEISGIEPEIKIEGEETVVILFKRGKRMHDDWKEELKEGDKVYLAFVCIDYAGSTPLYDILKKSEIKSRFDFYRNSADRIFESFGGVAKDWSGEGNVFFFGDPKRNVDEDTVKASIAFLTELKVGIDVEIQVRISINSSIVEFKKDMGKINAQEISFCGHLNSASPENAILITENIYYALPEELKEKFDLCGTTKRDKVITFIYPKEKKIKKSYEYFLKEDEDNSLVYERYIESLKEQCRTLVSSGIRQMRKFPSLELTEAFFPLKIRKFETGFEKAEYYSEDVLSQSIGTKEEKREFIFRRPPIDLTPKEFLDVFKKERHLVILGDPGSGKTTLLKYLCLIYSRGLKLVVNHKIDEETLFPILVPISVIYLERKKQEHISPADAISKYYEDLGIKNLNKLLEEKLEKGKCIILLDGLDEIFESKDRFSTARYIENFIRRFEKNRFIVTSRILGYEEIRLSSVSEYSLCSFEDKDIEKFILNWFTAFEKKLSGDTPFTKTKAEKEAKQLLSSIGEDENIKLLSSNPFLLTLICLIQKAGQTLPRYRIELYRLCAETLFETWLEARSLGGKALTKVIDYKEGEKVLAPLSLWMHENLPGGIGKKEVIEKKIIEIMKDRGISKEEAIKSTDEFFKYLYEQTQLLIPKGGEYYGYRHLTFEEFLSARALIMQELYDEYLKKYSYNPRWTEVFLLTAGWIGIYRSEIEVTRIVVELLKRDDDLEKILHKNLLLAGKIVVENPGVKKEVAEEVVDKIYDVFIKTHFGKLKGETLNILGKILLKAEGRRMYQILVSRLKDKNEALPLRAESVYILSSIIKEDKDVLDLLISILEDRNENVWVRANSADALSLVVKEDKEVLELLISILKDKSENRNVRKMSALALGNIDKENKKVISLLLNEINNKTPILVPSLVSILKLGAYDNSHINLAVDILKKGEDDDLFSALWSIYY